MASISKNVYINKLDGIVNDYNNTDHRAIKMKLVDVKTNTYFDSIKEVNDRDHWWLCQNIKIQKYYCPNWSEEIFVIKTIKSTFQWTYVIIDLSGENIIGTFFEKDLQKQQTKNNLG